MSLACQKVVFAVENLECVFLVFADIKEKGMKSKGEDQFCSCGACAYVGACGSAESWPLSVWPWQYNTKV